MTVVTVFRYAVQAIHSKPHGTIVKVGGGNKCLTLLGGNRALVNQFDNDIFKVTDIKLTAKKRFDEFFVIVVNGGNVVDGNFLTRCVSDSPIA